MVWGLQLQCLNDELFDKENRLKEKREMVNKAKRAIPRKIELSCLKNRYGKVGYSCAFDYYPNRDLFIEKGAIEEEAEAPGDDKFTPVDTKGKYRKRG